MAKRTFRVTFDMEFESDEFEETEQEINDLTCERLEKAIDAGFNCASEDFFGESICMAGLLTPKVNSVEEK